MWKRGPFRLTFLFLACTTLSMLALPWPVEAQRSAPEWRLLTAEHGLAANEVWTLIQDQRGALWFGTDGSGVSRFDGRWMTFTEENTAGGLAGNLVRAILLASDGTLWFGTSKGLSRYDGQGWMAWRREQGLPDGNVRCLLEADERRLLLGTASGAFVLDRQKMSFAILDALSNDNISSLLLDVQGALWVGTDEGLKHCQGPEWRACQDVQALTGVQVNRLLESRDGRLWVATLHGVRYFDGRDWLDLPVPEVWSLAQDDRGFLWLGTNGYGVYRYDGGQLTRLTTADGLAANNVTSILQDADGALWFATVGGVSRYDARTWQTPFRETIRALVRGPDGDLLLGSAEGGLRRFDGRIWHSILSPADGDRVGFPSDRISALCWAEDTLWVGTDGWGLARFDGQGWEVFSSAGHGLAADAIFAIEKTRDGTLWVGTHQGLSRYDGRRWETLTTANTPGLAGDWVLTLLEDEQGTLWVGTRGGVSRYDGQQWLEPLTRANSGLAANEVRAILQTDDGALWFGTWAGGVSRYQGGEWTTYTVADGLAANGVVAIAEDSQGGLWFGTPSGVTRYDGRTWRSYTASDGLANNLVRHILEDEQGVVWLGTEGGLSRYEPDAGLPKGYISAVSGQKYEGQEVAMLSGEALTISFGGGDLRTPPERLLSLCYLEGIEEGWHTCREGLVSYNRLAPGDYTFHLQVRDEDFNYSQPVLLPIKVSAAVILPWFGQPLALPVPAFGAIVTITLTAVGALLLFTVSRRQTQRKAREALRRKFNPYISGEPIRREDMFFGRADLLRRILHILHNNSIMIYGERRIGKTTLLYQLANRLRQDSDPEYRFIPVLIDLEGTPEAALFHTLMEGIVHGVRALLPELPPLLFRAESSQEYGDRDFSRDFSQLLAALRETTSKEIRIVLLMDEMDVIDTYERIVQVQLRRIFMQDFAQNLGAVVAGVQISKEWDRPESPWYNLFNEVELPPFSEEEARELITEPVKGVYRYDDQAVEQIIAYGEGRPHRIQQYCLEAVNHMLAARRTRVTLADVEAAHEAITQAWGEHPPPFPVPGQRNKWDTDLTDCTDSHRYFLFDP